jgi:uncharacterized protein YukE
VDPLAAAGALAGIDAGSLTTLVARLRAASQTLRSVAVWIRAAPRLPSRWSGAGHDAFAVVVETAGRRLSAAADALEVAGVALSALAVALQSVRDEVGVARRLLLAAGPTDPGPAIGSQLTDAVARFRMADLRAAGLVADALLLDLGRGSARPVGARLDAPAAAKQLAQTVSSAPPLPAGPAAVALWWAGLGAAARASAVAGWPGWPGALDGVPARVRDAVNRHRLAGALHDAAASCAAMPLAPTYAYLAARTRLRNLQALAAAIRPPGSELLGFDPSGDGEAVVSTADVERARSVAVLVPGMSNELDDVPALTREARRLAAAAGPGTAVVAWLGYDAPDVRQVISDGRARSGAQQLQRFVLGLRSTAARLQHVTVLGHSYGSLVAGLAARRGSGADDLVLLASPGVEASRASQLHVPAGHVWAARDATDPIQLVFWPSRLSVIFGIRLPNAFGPDPAAAPFGANRVAVGGAIGHSGYFAAGSQSLAGLAAIVSGRARP